MDVKALALQHGLTEEEYQLVLDELGRTPTAPEVGVVSAMWSEHCSYKSSRVHLKRLPTTGPQVVQGPGENAGAVDIGGGLAAVFKMESHNHPSYIEPYQGAATGVGGILRDVFTMGARPVGNLNSLRFGAVDHERTPFLYHGVVAGIAGYGNCVGVPTVGGEVYFDPSYNGNILVNVFTVGIAKKDGIFRGVAAGVGNPIFYVGAGTGRDGIHGATMASEQFDEGSEEKRPTVQVGDPFREKLLIEACLELMRTGAIIGIQDMGAAGLTSSSVEMADRGNNGVRIQIHDIPMREEGMNAYECLLSESQERMLVVLEKGREDEVGRVFDKWELEWAQIGEVIEGDRFEVFEGEEQVVDLPVGLLTSSAPSYERPMKRPSYMDHLSEVVPDEPEDLSLALAELLASPNICSRRPIFEQFDHMVGVGTVVAPGQGDAAVLRVPGSDTALAIAVDCNPRYCYLDPYEGAKLAVAECARNISCTGALPLGTTDCMNFGDPTNPEIMWQFARAIDGMSEACLALDVPVVGGNVSLYNASSNVDIYPTPTVALVGRFEQPLEEGQGYCTMGFERAGDAVILLGDSDIEDLGGSEYLWTRTGELGARPPRLDLEHEVELQKLLRELIADNLLASAHDCAEGGLGVAIVESCLQSKGLLGVDLFGLDVIERADLTLFCETPSRVVVSARGDDAGKILEAAARAGVSAAYIGDVIERSRVIWGDRLLALGEARDRHESGLDTLD